MALSRAALSSIRGLSCSTQLFSATCSCSYSSSSSSPPTGNHRTTRSLSTPAQNANLFSIKPHSLSHARLVNHTPDFVESSALLKSLLQLTGYYSRKSDLAEGAANLYEAITELLENDRIYEAFGLDKSNFMSGYSILSLHVWLAVSRLRGQGPDAKFVMQQMYDTFQTDVERRVYRAGIEMHLKKWVRKLEGIFYGTSIAYDKALRGEGSTLPDALLKNVYGNDIRHKQHADLLAQYLIRELECLELTPLEEVLKGHLQFSADRLLPSTKQPELRQAGQTTHAPL